ncbi:hypothetical protein [Crocosphaera sp. XPORK-15E]|uniref:hypothetical protein n=1 Tax=Crocosphaera sp. XPORK-15E TaxID=3110247 RepID=UPI002B1F2D30|nr:hypothetical protein [Crocosphaera sp. XPORK-15E]MEA5536010.1 hypothetical protein [Crocosphaera sp. XPORK-15E]
MAVQDKLQSLITDLERVLWEGQLAENPEVLILLERVRHYLLLCQAGAMDENFDTQAEKLTNMVLTRLETSLNQWLQPLQGELEQLHHQRQSLLQEIQTLEQQRQEILSEFLAKLSTHCDNSLPEPLEQTEPSLSTSLSSFDQTLPTVFESLREDLQTYSDSLREGLQRMHQLGQQGEAKFLAYCNRLQQQLELSLNQPTFKSPISINNPIINTSWYLGIDLTTNPLTAVLLQVNLNSPEQFSDYPLSELLNLSFPNLSLNESPLDYWKQSLNHLSTSLTDQSSLSIGEFTLESILGQLEGVVLICPARWNSGDRALLQTLLLETPLIKTPQQMLWVPKAIALALAYCPTQPHYETPQLSLVIELTETVTELALVDISQGFSGLTTQRFAYGSQGMNQDILCQLIYPQWYGQMTQTVPTLQAPFPQPGYPDLLLREGLSQQLQEHPLGNAMLEAAQLSRLILQQQETFSSTIAQQIWGVTRREMTEQIIEPWRHQLHQKITTLLTQVEQSSTAITQIILSGEGVSAISYGLSPWLTEKFPHATLIQEKNNDSIYSIFQGIFPLLSDSYKAKI